MQRRRLAQIAAIVVLALAASVCRLATGDAEGTSRAGATVGSDTLFQRFVVAPGGDASVLPLTVAGAHLIEIDRTGTLLVHNGERVRRQRPPRAYQDIDGRRRDVSVRFGIAAAGDVRLEVGPYDRTLPLVIEPCN
jgi:hypothetical protein